MALRIKANNISLSAHGGKILDQVALEVKNDDFITIIGPNGAGKTQLLRVLLGLTKPDEGEVIRQAELKIGYMPQTMMLQPTFPLRVKDFLMLKSGAAAGAGLEQVVAETQIERTLGKNLFALSSGERQRVLLAYALLGEPNLLVLDEPAQNLDVAGQLELYALLDKIYASAQGRLAILMVSHDLHFVMSSTKQVVCLFHHICCSGAPQQIAQDPAFVNLFGRSGQALLASYQHKHDHAH